MTSIDAALDRLEKSMHALRRSPITITNYLDALRRLHARYDLTQPTKAFATWHEESLADFEAERSSASKVRNEHVALRVFFDSVGVRPNPARSQRFLPRGAWEPKAVPLSDVQRLMDAVPLRDGAGDLVVDNLRDRAVLELLYNGLRRAEVCRLRTDRIAYSMEEGTLVLHVWGKATRGHPGGKWRHVPLAPHSALVLAWYLLVSRVGKSDMRAWLDEFREDLTRRKESLDLAPLLAVDRLVRKRLQDADPEPLVTMLSQRMKGGAWNPVRHRLEGGVWERGHHELTTRQVDRIFGRWRDAAGLPARYTPHAFRHACATELLRRNVDIKKIGEILGHSSPAVTQIYTNVVLDMKAEAMRSLPSAGRRVE